MTRSTLIDDNTRIEMRKYLSAVPNGIHKKIVYQHNTNGATATANSYVFEIKYIGQYRTWPVSNTFQSHGIF